jgi:hypothetical protein
MHKMGPTPATTRRRAWFTVRTVILGLGAIAIVWFIVQYFVRLRALGYVDSAIGTMRALAADENKFAGAHPGWGYTCELADITADPTIARGRKNEYVFEISGCRGKAESGPNTSYQMTARPLRPGMPAFCSDQSGIVKADYDGSSANCVKAGQPL